MKLSEFLKERLNKRGEQAKFARSTKISDGTVSKWARGNMERAPNFKNCMRIATWAKKSPLDIFEMAERPDFADLFLDLFPDYKMKSAPLQPPICPENNPEHISYHEKLEEVLHHPNAAIGSAVIYGLLGAYNAMPPEGEKVVNGRHGPLGNDRRPRDR